MLCLLVGTDIGGACWGVNNPMQEAQRRETMNPFAYKQDLEYPWR